MALASGALLVLAVVTMAALMGSEGNGTVELENKSKQQHFHQVFDRLEKKPSSGEVAQAARERKYAISKMSTDQARSVLLKWGFLPPAHPTGGKQALHEVARSRRSRSSARDEDISTKGASRKELARLKAEAGDDDLRPRLHDYTDERDMNEDSHAIEHDREVVNSHLSRAERDRARSLLGEQPAHHARHVQQRTPTHKRSRDRREDRREDDHESAPREARGTNDLEDVAVNLANAVQADQQGIVKQHQKLAADRNRLLQTRELIDKALSHLAEKSSDDESRREPARENRERDGADFTIRVRHDVRNSSRRRMRGRPLPTSVPATTGKFPFAPALTTHVTPRAIRLPLGRTSVDAGRRTREQQVARRNTLAPWIP